MKRVLTYILFLTAMGFLAYEGREYFFPPKPCAQPISYTLGSFDKKFGVTEEYFLKAVADAEKIWENALDRELFVYTTESDAKDTLQMNLVYDYRQEATTKLARIGSTLEDNQESYDIMRAEFESIRRAYEKDRSTLEAAIRAFNKKQSAYEAEVKYWNARGGAPAGEYAKLEQERRELEAEAAKLTAREKKLNRDAEEVNALVADLNTLARKLNLSVEHYNTVNDSRGETFEEGLFVQNGSDREINIFEFEDRAELVRLLAHELGHALTLEHVADPEAIMYELNESENIKPTAADLAELALRCGAK